MFYSHEILTSRKYGVATVWLVATLGPKSSLKKVNRRAILDVDVPKACETIVAPEAPMALRLQGNLLYGVSRVYSQQCGYVLADAQHTQDKIRALQRLIRTSELDPQAGKTRPDQLLLQDDPAFLPDLAWPDLDLTLSNLALSPGFPSSTQLASQQGSVTNRRESAHQAPAGLVIPTSDMGSVGELGGFALPPPWDDRQAREQEEAEEGFLPDIDFGFDAEGNIRSVGADVMDYAAADLGRVRLDSDYYAASERVRREHDEGLRARRHLGDDIFRDDGLDMNDEPVLPEAEPFPERNAAVSENVAQEDPTPQGQAVNVPLRRARRPRALEMDDVVELRRAELTAWNNNYVANMAQVARSKLNHQLPSVAKKNAAFWVFGAGIGNVGTGVGRSRLSGPLSVFSGSGLMLILDSPLSPPLTEKRKSPSDEQSSPESEGRRVRARREAEQQQIGRGEEPLRTDDLDPFHTIEDDDMEMGRDAPPDLSERRSSTMMMPWNVTASLRGSSIISRGRGRRSRLLSTGFPTSGGGGLDLSFPLPRGATSRLTPASPLHGRRGGRIELERLSSLELEAGVEDDDDDDDDDGEGEGEALLGRDVPEDEEAGEEFRLQAPPPGPEPSPRMGAAAMAMATATESQAAREALERDSLAFLEYLRAGVLSVREQRGEEGAGHQEGRQDGSVSFEQLIPPGGQNSDLVAAQAFHHALSLATMNFIRLEQVEGFGEIRMAPLTAVG